MISVLTPTWRRPFQLARCMRSVAAQTWRPLEHVIVSDGPDPALADSDFSLFCWQEHWHHGHDIRFGQMAKHDPAARWGHRAKLRAIGMARGDLIAWLDDDDAYRPRHLEILAGALAARPDAGFAFARMWIGHHAGLREPLTEESERRIHGGPPYPEAGYITGAQMIVHRRELLDIATIEPAPDSETGPEWRMVSRWLAAGVPWVFVDEVTVDAHCHYD